MQSYNLTNASGWYKTNRLGVLKGSGAAVYLQRSLNVAIQQDGDKRSPNNQSYSTTRVRNPKGQYVLIGQDGLVAELYYGVLTPSLPIFGSFDSNLDTVAYNSALSSITDQIRGGIDWSIDIAQRKQTFDMVRSAVHTASSSVEDIVRSAKRAIARKGKTLAAVHAVANNWLMYNYGVKPTCQTLYDTVEKVMSTDPADHRVTVKGRGSSRSSGPYTYSAGMVRLGGTFSRSHRCEIGLTLSPRTGRLSKLAGYTSLNPASIAWELLPYSFVIDWFIDVGGYLRSAESALVYNDNFVSGYSTLTRENNLDLTSNITYKNAGETMIPQFDPSYSVSRSKVRSRLSSYPAPRYPVIDVNLGSSRLFSAASLLSQFLGRKT